MDHAVTCCESRSTYYGSSTCAFIQVIRAAYHTIQYGNDLSLVLTVQGVVGSADLPVVYSYHCADATLLFYSHWHVAVAVRLSSLRLDLDGYLRC